MSQEPGAKWSTNGDSLIECNRKRRYTKIGLCLRILIQHSEETWTPALGKLREGPVQLFPRETEFNFTEAFWVIWVANKSKVRNWGDQKTIRWEIHPPNRKVIKSWGQIETRSNRSLGNNRGKFKFAKSNFGPVGVTLRECSVAITHLHWHMSIRSHTRSQFEMVSFILFGHIIVTHFNLFWSCIYSTTHLILITMIPWNCMILTISMNYIIRSKPHFGQQLWLHQYLVETATVWQTQMRKVSAENQRLLTMRDTNPLARLKLCCSSLRIEPLEGLSYWCRQVRAP